MHAFHHPHNVRGPESTRVRGLGTPDIVRVILYINSDFLEYSILQGFFYRDDFHVAKNIILISRILCY